MILHVIPYAMIFECFLLPSPILCFCLAVHQWFESLMVKFARLLLLVLSPSTYGGIRTLGVPLLPLLKSISEPVKLMYISKTRFYKTCLHLFRTSYFLEFAENYFKY